MKKFACLALVILMLLMTCAVPAFAEPTENVMTSHAGNNTNTNVPFDNGYYGFCIDSGKDGAKNGDQYWVAKDTSAAWSNEGYQGSTLVYPSVDISQKLKLLFVLGFEDIFTKNSDGNYELTLDVGYAVYKYSDPHLVSYLAPALSAIYNEVENYKGLPIDDHGHSITLANGDKITFDFIVLIPKNDDTNTRQYFFAYKLTVNDQSDDGNDGEGGEPITPPTTYVITFKSGDGTGKMDPQTVPAGNHELNPNSFTREGYEFTGWVDEHGKHYTDKAEIPVDSDLELTAQWKKKEYKVNFDANGGAGEMAPQTFKHDEEQALNPNTFTREGYEFLGWKDKDGNSYNDNALVKVKDGDVTLYAQWKETEPDQGDLEDPIIPGGDDFDDPELPGGDDSDWGDNIVPSEPEPELPKTGDASAPALWACLLLLSLCGFACMRRKATSR